MDRKYYYLDKLALKEEILAGLELASNITINDCTLREADQVVSFSPEEKCEIAHKLEELGVHRIQVGIPGVSESDKAVIKRLKHDRLKTPLQAVAFVYLKNWKEQINACLESGADSIHLFYTISDEKLQLMGITREEMFDNCARIISYAKEQGASHLAFCPFPAVRVDFEVLIKTIEEGYRAGAEEILIADTYGTCSPTAMKWFFAKIRERTKAKLGIHCHNDMGLALANSMAAVEAGAEIVDATVNGLGDRTGNCSLDEAVIAIQGFYNIDLGIKTEEFYKLAKLVERLSNIPRPFGKPLVGENAFIHKHDDDIKSALAISGSTVPIEPSLVGNKRQILLGGEYAGSYTVAAKAEELGVKLNEEQVLKVLKKVRQQLLGRKEPMKDEEFRVILKEFSS